MNDLNIRVTHRVELNGRVSERVIDIETIPNRYNGSVGATDAIPPLPFTETPHAAPAKLEVTVDLPRPQKILADGSHVDATNPRTDHVAVLFADGWMVAVAPLTSDGNAFTNHQAAEEGAGRLDLLSYDDWQLAPLEVWERHVLNRQRHNPAVHIDLFPNVRTDDWYWTGNTCVWSVDESTGVAASAWSVDTDGGFVYSLLRNGSGFALAARRAGQ